MILLFDIGNTHTHVGLAIQSPRAETNQHFDARLVWAERPQRSPKNLPVKNKIEGAILCSVVPRATPLVRKTVFIFGN
ncbi:MAG: type III pantothenate kinase [Limisphaerales bacterium]